MESANSSSESDESGNLNNILNVEPPASDNQARAAAVTEWQHEIEHPSAKPVDQSSTSQSFGLDGMDDSDGEDERSFAREAALTENPSVDMHTTDAELENDDLPTFHKANGHRTSPSAIAERLGGCALPVQQSTTVDRRDDHFSTDVQSDLVEPLVRNPQLYSDNVDRDRSVEEVGHVSRKSMQSQHANVGEDGAKNISWLSRIFRSIFGPLASMLCVGHRK